MEEQIQRQSHIILQLRQKTLQQSVEDGQNSVSTFVFMDLVSVHSLTFSCKTENKRFLQIR